MQDIAAQIDAIRQELGKKLLILGHHYQRSSVLRHADETGDSLELARKASMRPAAEKIVFCGVHFMAESADILSGKDQTVYMPEPSAGCPMAKMADAESMEAAWKALEACGEKWLPVVYVNSTARIKALCGKLGGSACTSGNAGRVFKWVLSQGRKVFFLPDEHLGFNTAHDMGIREDEIVVYDPARKHGGILPEAIVKAKVVVWKGFCLVHTAFTVEQVNKVREHMPDAKIIVHPEAPKEVVSLADAHGSTSQIIKYVQSAPESSTVVIGTELNLVQRLAEEHGDRVTVKALLPSVCANMAVTNESNLLALLREWPATDEIHVSPTAAADAHKALGRMLKI